MPLIVISGLPASGKSTRAEQLNNFFAVTKGKKVTIVSENKVILKSGLTKNDLFADSKKEKPLRSDLKSEALRHLNKDDVVILDAGNYIKGYRYELYCASKEARTTQCTLYCAITKEQALEFNTRREDSYSSEIFEALFLRFEEPQHNNRWDAPLFTCFPEDQLDLDAIHQALFERKPPKPNQSTQSAPLCSPNYLFELDKVTQSITERIVSARKAGICGPITVDPAKDLKVSISEEFNAGHLNRLRRQFLAYTKSQTGTSIDQIPTLFVQFLNSSQQ